MSSNLVCKIYVVICIGSLVLRRCFVDQTDINLFMQVVNGLALWVSIVLVLEKGVECYRKKLIQNQRQYQQSKSYRSIKKTSLIVSFLSAIGIIGFIYTYDGLGDYITILTLGLALTTDIWAEIFCCCFKFK